MTTSVTTPSLATIAFDLTDWRHPDELVAALRVQAARLAEVGAGERDPRAIDVDAAVLERIDPVGWYTVPAPGVELGGDLLEVGQAGVGQQPER